MFVCFEGIDGAGKSTQARMLLQRLRAAGTRAELVADPGTTKIGAAVRQILLHNDAPISAAAQMLLFSAARAELADHIRQLLAAGVVVICDRWLLSTLVYQGEINKIPLDLILKIFEDTAGLLPDVCFLLDIPADTAATRVGAPGDRYERLGFDARQQMRCAYIAHANRAKNTHIVPADTSADELHETVYQIFLQARSR